MFLKRGVFLNINKIVLQVLQTLQQKNSNTALFGGYLRDSYIGVIPKDADFITNLSIEEIKKIYPNVSFRKTMNNLDVCFFQKNNIFFEIISTKENIEQKVSKSDLTVNTLLYNDKLIDTTTALQDISNKFLQFTNREAYIENITASPHSWLKPFRLGAKLSFTLDEPLLDVLKENKSLFEIIPTSIKTEEAYKILSTDNPMTAIKNLSKIGIFSNFDTNFDDSFVIDLKIKNQYHLMLCILAILSNKDIILEFIRHFAVPQKIEEKFKTLYLAFYTDELPSDYHTLNELLYLKRIINNINEEKKS